MLEFFFIVPVKNEGYAKSKLFFKDFENAERSFLYLPQY